MIAHTRLRTFSSCGITLGVLLSLACLLLTTSYTNQQVRVLHVESSAVHTTLIPQPLKPEYAIPKSKIGIGFLKVHKAASTTTQAMFLRYGWTRNLTFILPPEYNAFGYPNIISNIDSLTPYNIVPPPHGKSFDILCHHVVYDKEAWSTYLPNNTLTVGTVRQPFSLFVSMLNYMNPGTVSRIKGDDQLGQYLRNPMTYETPNVRRSFTNNRMSVEYGVDPEIIMDRDVNKFKEYVNQVLDKEFDMVIVAERYDESLVLMKRVLNWTLNDIMYAMKNVRSEKKPDRYEVKEGFEELYRNFSTFDYMLYDFFVNKLNRQIANEGESFKQELHHFLETRAYVETFCHRVPIYVKSVTINKSPWNDQFEITREYCDVLHKGEIEFTQEIRRLQYGSATWKYKGH